MDFIFANFTTLASYRVYENTFKSLILQHFTLRLQTENIWIFPPKYLEILMIGKFK